MLAVCPNPTIDRLVQLAALRPGTVDRVHRNLAFPAGKSVSAARGARANGADPEVQLLLPSDGAAWYLDTLAAEGVRFQEHGYPGQVRESIILIEDTGRVTVLNGPGAVVEPLRWTEFVTAVCVRIRPGEWVICSGSFPPGVGPDALSGFVAAVAAAGGRLALDTGPAWMGAALAGPAKPSLITPNLAEAEAILGGEAQPERTTVDPDALARAESAAQALRARGVASVVVTAGAAGLAWASDQASGTIAGLPVEVRNPIGAGDAVMGGLVARLEQGHRFPDAVAWGLATSAAAIEQWSPGAADPARVGVLHDLLLA